MQAYMTLCLYNIRKSPSNLLFFTHRRHHGTQLTSQLLPKAVVQLSRFTKMWNEKNMTPICQTRIADIFWEQLHKHENDQLKQCRNINMFDNSHNKPCNVLGAAILLPMTHISFGYFRRHIDNLIIHFLKLLNYFWFEDNARRDTKLKNNLNILNITYITVTEMTERLARPIAARAAMIDSFDWILFRVLERLGLFSNSNRMHPSSNLCR